MVAIGIFVVKCERRQHQACRLCVVTSVDEKERTETVATAESSSASCFVVNERRILLRHSGSRTSAIVHRCALGLSKSGISVVNLVHFRLSDYGQISILREVHGGRCGDSRSH